MLMGQSEGLSTWGSSKSLLLSDPVAEMDDDEAADDEPEKMSNVLHVASFEELKTKIIAYDTIIWLWISLLLVLAWGIGALMLLYLPFKRYVLRKDIASRKLYVTSDEIIYKVSRPSYVPFYGEIKIQKRVPLHLVIDIILEQGCLQSIYGIHNIRVESIADGKAAPVDELQLQGVHNPQHLRKVIVTQAAKVMQEIDRSMKANVHYGEGESLFRTESLTEAWLRSPSKSSAWRAMAVSSPCHNNIFEHSGAGPSDAVLNKLEEVNRSVKNIELLIEKAQAAPRTDP